MDTSSRAKVKDSTKDTTLSLSPLVNNSTDYGLKDKTILVIGGHEERKMHILDIARDIGAKIVLVDGMEKAYMKRHSSYFIHYDCTDNTKDDVHVDKITEILHSKGIILDGCVTFNECYSPLTAKLCSKLNLNGAGKEGAIIAKSKYLTQKILSEGNLQSSLDQIPRTRIYTSKTVRVHREDEINSAIVEVGLPAVLKFEYGAGTFYVKKVFDLEECINEYKKFQNKYLSDKQNQSHSHGFGHGSTLVLMEYVEGTEHDINIVLLKGQQIGAFIQDKGRTRARSFRETSSNMPTFLTADKKVQIVEAAYTCCRTIGLVTGVFNVTMKMTKTGPKLLEINARMTGVTGRYLTLRCYGIDLAICAFMTCCGLRPTIPNGIPPRWHIMGVVCQPDIHKEQLSSPEIIKLLTDLREKSMVIYIDIAPTFDHDDEDVDDGVCMGYCSVAVIDCDMGTAKAKLLRICNDLQLNTPDYPIEEFLGDFNDKTND